MNEWGSVTRRRSYELITSKLDDLKGNVVFAVKEALFSEELIPYLKEKKLELPSLYEAFDHYKVDKADQKSVNIISEFSTHPEILNAYIRFIVLDMRLSTYDHPLKWQLFTGVQIIDDKAIPLMKAELEKSIDAFLGDGSIQKIAINNAEAYEKLADMVCQVNEKLIIWFMVKLGKIKPQHPLTEAESKLIEAIIKRRKEFSQGMTDVDQLLAKLESIGSADKKITEQLIFILIAFVRHKKSFLKNDDVKTRLTKVIESLYGFMGYKTQVYTLLSMLGGYNFLSIKEIEVLLHKGYSDRDHFTLRQDDFYKHAVELTMIEIQQNKHQAASEHLLNWFNYLFQKIPFAPDFKLFSLLYNFSNSHPTILSFNDLMKIKIKNNDANIMQHVCDFIFAIVFSEDDIVNKKNKVGQLFSLIPNVPQLLKDLELTLRAYFDKSALPLSQKQRDEFLMLSSLFDKSDRYWEIIVGIETELNNIDLSDNQVVLDKKTTGSPGLEFNARRLHKSTESFSPKRKSKGSESPTPPSKRHAASVPLKDKNDVAIRPSALNVKHRFDLSPPAMMRPSTPSRVIVGTSSDISFNAFKATVEPNDECLYHTTLFQKENLLDEDIKEATSSHSPKKPKKKYLSEEEYEETMRSNREVGIWGESAMFFNLKKKYKSKYSAVEIASTDSHKFSLKGLHKTKGKIYIEVTWPNQKAWLAWCEKKKENKGEPFIDPGTQPYDLEIKKFTSQDEKTRYIEVKSTPSAKKTVSTLTGNEFDFMRLNDKNYRAYRCYLAGTSSAFFVKYKNLRDKLLDRKIPIQKIEFLA